MVSVNLILRDNLILKAQYAKSEYEEAAQEEAEALNRFEEEVNKYIPTGSGNNTNEIVWGYEGTDLYYMGNANELTISSDTITAKPVTLTYDGKHVSGAEFVEDGEPKTFKMADEIGEIYLKNPNTGVGPEIININNLNGAMINPSVYFPKNAKRIKIQDTWTRLWKSIFYDITSLEYVELPSSLTSLGNGDVFVNCTSLESINIPLNITSIPYRCFVECTKLKEVQLPASINSILENAFYNCTGLQSFTIPESVTSIAANAFEGCTGLKTIIFNKTQQDAAALGTDWIPASVTNIQYTK